jgi:site-specific DNA-methyltransferase (adenine-specific)
MIVWMNTTKMAKINRLKPAHEPIFVAQKPLDGSISANFERWGCGKINVETTRIPWDKAPPTGWVKGGHTRRSFGGDVAKSTEQDNERIDADERGRYPSNIIGYIDEPEYQKYFYAPRVSKAERGEFNDHPTPKPIDLMRYLCKVYAPAAGTVLDPFMGSGSTGIAALKENMKFIGIDQSQHYCDIAHKRIATHLSVTEIDNDLFSFT